MTLARLKYPLIAISAILFLISLSQPAFDYEDIDGIKTHSAISLLLMGGISFLGGALFEWITWLANPFYIIGLVLFIKNNSKAQYFVVFSAVLSLSFSAWHEILAAENGRTAPITGLHAGYYLWVIGQVILVIDVFFCRKSFGKQPYTK